jgi:hypothetical protein
MNNRADQVVRLLLTSVPSNGITKLLFLSYESSIFIRFGGMLPLFLFIFTFIEHKYNICIYNTRRVPLLISSLLPLGRGPPLGCRAGIRTRAWYKESWRPTIWATLQPSELRRILWATPHPVWATPHPIWATLHPKAQYLLRANSCSRCKTGLDLQEFQAKSVTLRL